MRRMHHWLVCDRDERHQFGPATSGVELLVLARERGWRLAFEGRDVCSICDREEA